MPTIVDVARLADVSIATVSRVINGDAAVRPRTRRVVEEAIARLDYRPNAAARSLRMARSHTLGLVVSDLENPIFIDVVHGIEAVARERGYSLFLCDAANDREAQNAHLERLYERRVDGMILYAIGDPPAGPIVTTGVPFSPKRARPAGGSPIA
jgi:LacI family transcriptional regulator